jgi:hypothetical protein
MSVARICTASSPRRECRCPFPFPHPSGARRHSYVGLCDVCLALSAERSVVGNNLDADAKNLVIITGANQGGKSTFLRSERRLPARRKTGRRPADLQIGAGRALTDQLWRRLV